MMTYFINRTRICIFDRPIDPSIKLEKCGIVIAICTIFSNAKKVHQKTWSTSRFMNAIGSIRNTSMTYVRKFRKTIKN